jgi:VanZ family protein
MSARSLKWLARAALLLLTGIALFGMVGPNRDLERFVIPWDKASHFITFYLMTVLTFLSFPKSRRTDLIQLLLLIAVGSEVAQAMVGRDAEVADGVADVLAILTVFATSHSEQLRRRYRDSPYRAAFSSGRRRSSSPRRPGVRARPAARSTPHATEDQAPQQA